MIIPDQPTSYCAIASNIRAIDPLQTEMGFGKCFWFKMIKMIIEIESLAKHKQTKYRHQ